MDIIPLRKPEREQTGMISSQRVLVLSPTTKTLCLHHYPSSLELCFWVLLPQHLLGIVMLAGSLLNFLTTTTWYGIAVKVHIPNLWIITELKPRIYLSTQTLFLFLICTMIIALVQYLLMFRDFSFDWKESSLRLKGKAWKIVFDPPGEYDKLV